MTDRGDRRGKHRRVGEGPRPGTEDVFDFEAYGNNAASPTSPSQGASDEGDDELEQVLAIVDGTDVPSSPEPEDSSFAETLFDQEQAGVEGEGPRHGDPEGEVFDIEVWDEPPQSSRSGREPQAPESEQLGSASPGSPLLGDPAHPQRPLTRPIPPSPALERPTSFLESDDDIPAVSSLGLARPRPVREEPAGAPRIEVYVRPRAAGRQRAVNDAPLMDVADAERAYQQRSHEANEGAGSPQFDASGESAPTIDAHEQAADWGEGVPPVSEADGLQGYSHDQPVEGDNPEELEGAEEIDMSPVTADEMTGIWLTTVTGHASPVWLDGVPAEPEDLDADPIIVDRLRDWADMWNTQWDPESGWLPRARITDFEALGQWLGRRVKDASNAVKVTVHLAHLGRPGITVVDPPETRRPVAVRLMNDYGVAWPVWVEENGQFVTEYGVGSFSSEVNARLENWALDFAEFMDGQLGWRAPETAARHAEEGRNLAQAMQEELGPDYEVDVDVWEVAPLL